MIYRWRLAEGKLKAAKENQVKRGSGRRPLYFEEERQVVDNAKEERQRGCCVSYSSMAVEMREAVNTAHPESNFKASSGWIRGMKKRTACTLRVPNLLVPASKWDNAANAANITEKHEGQIKDRLVVMQLTVPVFGVH